MKWVVQITYEIVVCWLHACSIIIISIIIISIISIIIIFSSSSIIIFSIIIIVEGHGRDAARVVASGGIELRRGDGGCEGACSGVIRGGYHRVCARDAIHRPF